MEDTTEDKEKQVTINEKDLNTLTELLETYKRAILGHEERIQVLEKAVATFHQVLTKPKMFVPKGK